MFFSLPLVLCLRACFFGQLRKKERRIRFLGLIFHDVLFRTKTKSLNFDGEAD